MSPRCNTFTQKTIIVQFSTVSIYGRYSHVSSNSTWLRKGVHDIKQILLSFRKNIVVQSVCMLG